MSQGRRLNVGLCVGDPRPWRCVTPEEFGRMVYALADERRRQNMTYETDEFTIHVRLSNSDGVTMTTYGDPNHADV